MIFADSSFWIAIRNDRDARHEEAVTLLRSRQAQPLVTTNHVRGETWTYLRRKVGHARAVSFLNDLGESRRFSVVFVTEDLEQSALRWLRRHDEREYSYVDATSFAVMNALRIREALAFDHDFTTAGFVELRA